MPLGVPVPDPSSYLSAIANVGILEPLFPSAPIGLTIILTFRIAEGSLWLLPDIT